MKKLILLSALSIASFNLASAQDFEFDDPVVTVVTEGIAAGADPNDAVTILNHLNNVSNGILSGAKWQIIEAFDNTAAPYLGWDVHSFCDNNLCYYGSGLKVAGSNPVEYNVFDFGDIEDRGRSDFKMQILVPSTAAEGTSGVVKVRAWTPNQDDTATFIATKSATGINVLKLNDNRVGIFPNPSNGDFKVFVNKDMKAKEVVVYNILGAQVASVVVEDEITAIKNTNLAKGNYLVKVLDSKGAAIATRKVTIK
jgi:hypothetical protein